MKETIRGLVDRGAKERKENAPSTLLSFKPSSERKRMKGAAFEIINRL